MLRWKQASPGNTSQVVLSWQTGGIKRTELSPILPTLNNLKAEVARTMTTCKGSDLQPKGPSLELDQRRDICVLRES